jgi:ADP-dependent NAD(P)H-hydrate dehydratase / NAD(P)H-hydrate epimerase
MRVCTVQEMRDFDRTATESYGLSEVVLMENAGRAVYDVAKLEFGTADRHFTVLCGGGNNGGDGFVAARLLHSAGAVVRAFCLVDESSIAGAARVNFDAARLCGVPLERIRSADELNLGRTCDVIIDAIFGTGLSRAPEGLHADVIEHINRSTRPVLSVDIPSGVDSDTGAVRGVSVRAECTVTFGLPKRGNLLPPGRELCGKLYVSHISFPPRISGSVGDVVTGRLTPLPARALESHKGMYGDVLFVAGARSYLGAPYLAAMSFLRAGGGYARLATPASLVPVLGSRAHEVVMVPLRETDEGTIAASNLDMLCSLADKVSMVVIGPGVSLHQETQQLVRDLVRLVSTPVLIDGDGLTAIAQDPSCVRDRTASTVLTPHVGEMARLLGITVGDVEKDRIAAVQQAVSDFGAIALLKGSSTLVGERCGPVSLNLSGNPGMATAGCGDVLAGTIAAMHGIGLEPRSAAEVGAFIHGVAGDLAAGAKGMDGLIARDVVEHLPAAVRLYRERFHETVGNHYGRLSVI